MSTADAYITPAEQRRNLSVISGARAHKIRFAAGRAVALDYRDASGLHTIAVGSEIIVSAGAVNSPQLLLLSGIGPADELRAHGITVVSDRSGVGRNLHNHPVFALQYALAEPLSARAYLNPLRAMKAGLRYALSREGPLAESYVATGGMLRTDPSLEIADIIVVMVPALTFRGGVGAKLRELLPQRHGFVVAVSNGRPSSRGRVTLASADPERDPLIYPEYFSARGDLETLTRGIQIMRDAMRGPRMGRLIAAELQPSEPANDAETVRRAIRLNGGTIWHGAGTCRMGADAEAVVDPRLRVNGIAGLRVADASVMPTPLNASTHAAAIMIGEKAAAMIREDAQT